MENNVEVAVQATENASTEQRPAARQENSERPQRQSYNRQQRRRKVCTFCTERDAVIDYTRAASPCSGRTVWAARAALRARKRRPRKSLRLFWRGLKMFFAQCFQGPCEDSG